MTRRINQVNELLRVEIATFLARDVEFPPGMLVTVTRVETLPDFERANIFVSVLPFHHHETVFRILEKHKRVLLQALHKKIILYRIPTLSFVLDDTEEKAAEVEAILDSIPDLRHDKGL